MRYDRNNSWIIRILDAFVGIIAIVIILGFAVVVYVMDLIDMGGPTHKQV
jgi:lipopolysaccharide/colanic/teichoic acid biosynthesis glycosyltransferase